MLLSALAEIVGPRHVRNDRDALEKFGVDRSSGWRPAPTCVVLPGSTAEVQRIVQLAREQRIALVPSGGRTGLSGGAVARNGELVVALERMDRLIDFDPVARSLTVQAGMITARVQEHASAQGFHYGVDFASAGSSHIGGNVATNAGGTRVIRYGMTRDQVLGLQVVDGNGEVLELFKKNGWETIEAAWPAHKYNADVSLITGGAVGGYYGESWISMNTFALGPKTICVEAHETAYIEQLDKLGIEVVPVPYEHVVPFGGSLHCTTLDIYRESTREDYFPKQ